MRNFLPLESLKQIRKGEAALGCCLEARDELDDFRKRPEHTSHRDSNMELLPLLMCGRVQRNGFIFSPFPLSSQESLNRSVGGVVPSSGKQSSSVIQGQVSSPISSYPGQLEGPAALGSLVAIPARAWSSAVWRGPGQRRAGEQARQSDSSVSLEQFKLLFLHLTALCQP